MHWVWHSYMHVLMEWYSDANVFQREKRIHTNNSRWDSFSLRFKLDHFFSRLSVKTTQVWPHGQCKMLWPYGQGNDVSRVLWSHLVKVYLKDPAPQQLHIQLQFWKSTVYSSQLLTPGLISQEFTLLCSIADSSHLTPSLHGSLLLF